METKKSNALRLKNLMSFILLSIHNEEEEVINQIVIGR